MSRLDAILAEARELAAGHLPDHFTAKRFARVLAAIEAELDGGTAVESEWFREQVERRLVGLDLEPAPPVDPDQLDLFGEGRP